MVNGFKIGEIKVLADNLTSEQRFKFINRIRERGFKLMYEDWGYIQLIDLKDNIEEFIEQTGEIRRSFTPVGFISPYKSRNRDKNNCIILMNLERENLRKYHNLLEDVVKNI